MTLDKFITCLGLGFLIEGDGVLITCPCAQREGSERAGVHTQLTSLLSGCQGPLPGPSQNLGRAPVPPTSRGRTNDCPANDTAQTEPRTRSGQEGAGWTDTGVPIPPAPTLRSPGSPGKGCPLMPEAQLLGEIREALPGAGLQIPRSHVSPRLGV